MLAKCPSCSYENAVESHIPKGVPDQVEVLSNTTIVECRGCKKILSVTEYYRPLVRMLEPQPGEEEK